MSLEWQAQQPLWDGNHNLAEAQPGQRVRGREDVFAMTLTGGASRENHIVEFDEGRLIAWRPLEPGKRPPGHLWRWELEPLTETRTKVTHSYDWSQLTDENRLPRARRRTGCRHPSTGLPRSPNATNSWQRGRGACQDEHTEGRNSGR